MGKQVYITDERHKKLKVASIMRDEDMGEIIGKKIDRMEVPKWDEIADDIKA